MNIDDKKIAKAICKIEQKNKKVTLKGIADLTGYTYQQLYCNGYKHLVKPHSKVVEESVQQEIKPTAAPKIEELKAYKERSDKGSWVKTIEKCPKCKRIDRTLFWETNSPSEFKKFWLSFPSRVAKCHKVKFVEFFGEGDKIKAQVSKLSIEDRARYALTVNFNHI